MMPFALCLFPAIKTIYSLHKLVVNKESCESLSLTGKLFHNPNRIAIRCKKASLSIKHGVHCPKESI